MKSHLLLLAVAVAAATGCTTRAWYEGAKQSAANECRRLPPGDVDACLARVNPLGYEDYERRRAGTPQ